MPSERIQRQIDQHLDAAEQAGLRLDWSAAVEHAGAALGLDPDNEDAPVLRAAAERRLTTEALAEPVIPPVPVSDPSPRSFANGRYEVKRFLGEGARRRSTSRMTRGSIGTWPSP